MNILPLFLMTFFVTISAAIIKTAADRLHRVTALFIQYFFCSVYIVAFWIFFDRTMFSAKAFIFVALVLGFLNYLGAYCQWAAYKINMARTSLFLPLGSVLAIALFWVFLKEYKHLSSWSLIGVGLNLVAIWIFISVRRKGQTNREGNIRKWLLYTVIMVISHGIIGFLMKFLSRDISKTHFLLCWYCGTFVFSAFFLSVDRGPDAICDYKQKKVFWFLPLCSLAIMGYLTSLYWAFQINSGTLVVSYSALNSTFVPVITGWLFFKEAKGISRKEIVGLTCGIVAAVLIIAFH